MPFPVHSYPANELVYEPENTFCPAKSGRIWGLRRICQLASLAALACVPLGSQQPSAACKSIHDPALTKLPDANQQLEMHEQEKQKNTGADYAAANVERKKQISDDSAKLLKLATELKSEVDKTTKDTLSLGVIRKADEIEKLAHSVKEKMKLTAGGS